MPDRLTPLDQTFLLLERDGQPMHIGSLMIFDGPTPSYEELCAYLDSRLDQVPRYRQKIQSVPLNLSQPIWVDDPDFELEYHVRHTAVPKPGKTEQLGRLASRLLSQRLDLDRPLWEMWLVEGLAKGQWALINKVHHSMIDGLSGHDIMEVLLDTSASGRDNPPSQWEPEPAPGTVSLVTDAVVDSVKRPTEHLQRMVGRASNPKDLAEHMAVRVVGAWPIKGRMFSTDSAIGGNIGPHRRWGWVEGDLSMIKTVKNEFGGTVNDVILTAVSGGFRQLLLSRHVDPSSVEIFSMIPVSMRQPGKEGGGNEVASMFVAMPAEIEDPIERLHDVTKQMNVMKKSGTPIAVDSIIGMADFVPPMLFAAAGRAASGFNQKAFDTVTTNVPGPQVPLYMMGRQLDTLIPFVPLGAGVRIATAIASYDGTINFGVTADYDSMRDMQQFLDGIADSLEDMGKAVLKKLAKKSSSKRSAAKKTTAKA